MRIDLFTIAAILFAYLVKGMCGFANTLIFTTMLSFRNNSIQITPVDLLLSIPSNLLISLRERKAVRLKTWLPLAVMLVISSIPGIFLLKFGDVSFLKALLGIAIVCIGIEMLTRERQKKKQKSSVAVLLLIGIVSGFLCGLFGISALLAAYMSRTTDSADAFRGNLGMVFLTDNLFRLVIYIATGILTRSVVKTALILSPFMLLGLAAGMFLSKVMDEKIVKRMVIIMLILSGISLFVTNIA